MQGRQSAAGGYRKAVSLYRKKKDIGRPHVIGKIAWGLLINCTLSGGYILNKKGGGRLIGESGGLFMKKIFNWGCSDDFQLLALADKKIILQEP